MSKALLRQITEVQGRIHMASDLVFQITGRSDQDLLQLAMAYPDHPAVNNLRKLKQELKALVDQIAPDFEHIRGY